MKLLIGSSGLVGQTIQKYEKFDHAFNTKNINTFNNVCKNNDEIFLSCLPATKWLVNKNIQKDIENINNIVNIISKKHYSKVTLISTIDVYNDSPLLSNEDYSPNVSKLNYGNNRYIFELLVKEYISTDNLKIFRLPSLYNSLIKKNILYDLLNNNNIDKINKNSYYQWYNLDNLHKDIKFFSEKYKDEVIFNLFTEPVHTEQILNMFEHHKNTVSSYDLIEYNYKTKFGEYIDSSENVLNEIKNFVNGFINK